jgi:type IV pilus assembly protein PilB
MGVHEVMVVSENIERLAVENAASDEIKRMAVSEGMLTLRDDGFSKVKLGQTSIEEILRVVV